ncbi:MAG: type IV pili twitching motility protein PilT [Candidatus Schekmanbacteria bacterium RIFCSPHIGHO2_02_FULL_38_11]|uniref:Type IV pili twitching motility protein PilT n=1 Tax=Candidatus Schekmanbacteria bacterium RIFCSPLOWO2_12_FULL_38_15 TaxID=1817883 RepID=A0A1F7SJ83_9BACT|nr:MAG: type IV pili twitching motility protein PilT [Candidatus Schekmanbacteria bacterium GWA2_38_9]OGL51335.1 MAG: type IV pili twitching motility protein PilT [Candidatus Schekmanbacteria bacterium RIFCSPLOWO2_02_FULL_38_14]OGL53298.1 MAG: type IV pili twitching motility protein PilT [Candidatus Schekmanbacteria bacterium RIFCSPLOWO2_12_FULL_38_15]OGL55657.1 MAG: type IV pili twitching motility protein PilT [Candidatus Schekmanbacteria bacterium RIFCSPHIGHO2_02_FULL_38_11]
MTIQDLVREMVKRDSSDIYITAELPSMYRTEGVTEPFGNDKFTPEQTKELAYSTMNDWQKKEFEETKEMNLALFFPELGRFRVNIFVQRGNVGIVIRQIKLDIKTVDQLGLPPILKDIIMAKRGMVLVVGGTGSGKSTSLAAMIDHRNSNSSGHIISIEDPIEFVHHHKKSVITQREVGFDTHSFANALKNTLRQAPDVILIGEIRDTETMESAITFAETGHLCLGTLHANNANQSIERVLNFFPTERHSQIYLLLSLNLKAIISQRLIPTVDGKRAAAIEVLLDTSRVKDLILKGEVGILKEVMAEGTQEGMQTFDQALYNLYKAERITYDNAIAYADSANDLRLRIKMDEISDKKDEKKEKEPSFKIKSQDPYKR